MIAFASLFLGLVFGVQSVEVVVGDAVAAVELRLDGRRLGVIREAPWTMECDFGSEIAPRRLEAVAFDAENRELGRVSQWLNLPQPQVVASVVLDPRRPGEPRIARLSWESTVGAEPESVTAILDGQPLPLDDPRRIVLPPVDEREFHLLHIELRFENRVSSRVDVTFGGAYADVVNTEITALALLAATGSRREPSVAAIQGWFVKDGAPLRVLAIEKESAEVVVVMDRPFPHLLEPGERYKPPKSLVLEDDERFRFLSTVPEQSQGVATTFELFPISPAYGAKTGDVYWLLSRLMRPAQHRRPRPTSAIAVAGLAAYEGRHRRAVVLVPSPRPPDVEELTPKRVLRYLDRLGVPVFVWEPGSRPSPHLAAWGEVRTVGSLDKLAVAFAELRDHLARQWIVWLDGRHLPQDVTLAPEVEDFTLLRRRPRG
ncbi:MAG: hypothetical protein GY856_14455 [bacterium]|nr:hypothetical protein [bacterium]